MNNRSQALTNAVGVFQAYRQAKGITAKAKLTDKTFYINVRVDGMSGLQDLIDANTKRVVGVTNFDGEQFAEGRDVVFDSVRVQYTATGTLPENANYDVGAALPVSLQSAELRLIQDGENLVELPVIDCQNLKNIDYREIGTTPLLRSKESFKLQLEFPKGVSVPNAAPLFAKISFRAIQSKK